MSFKRRSGGQQTVIPAGLGYGDIQQVSQLQAQISEVPQVPLPVNSIMTTRTEQRVAKWYALQHATLRDSVFFSDTRGGSVTTGAPIVARYSDRYLRQRSADELSLDNHPFNLMLFPTELHGVMGGRDKKRLLKLQQRQQQLQEQQQQQQGIGQDGDPSEEELGRSMLEKLKELAEEVEEESVLAGSGDPSGVNGTAATEKTLGAPPQEIEDEDFEDSDDDDDNDDYNAEKYFNDGDDDDDGAGDDDGYGDEPAF
ncbi:DNA-directed RNA polymerase III subunit C31 KNAG_0I02350 [Huiozyma naganishii CBS 8797]|uniref:DNA-directed RNA polymerase III subunit n=1 Tax=Huiozyma naganishii (strain ATCC MYA-139 / BCRC 22969 / CBS 8797 / KCTC 17520 / NBRC 10181 / NCYC 3082 / Yp74L-3) TaxID=1071383 RepID=J7SAB8_HUIN7|nr:hypothetical protein KNAG_0I02350 [Kazachstania naganishii CBS 8797]CCK72021.1 hypothetical protein KNAG_0I02350 [Kazachstania naganishii CBS 8797]